MSFSQDAHAGRAWWALVVGLGVILAAPARGQDNDKDKQKGKDDKPKAEAAAKVDVKEAPAAKANGRSTPTPTPPSQPQAIKLKEPVPYRVYQRYINGRADIPLAVDDGIEDAEIVEANLAGVGVGAPVRFSDGMLRGVPVGGPYTIQVAVRIGTTTQRTSVGNIYVGDLWVLAGQSNMEGVGDLVDVTPPTSNVLLLGMNGSWSIAEEPLHWLVDSPDPVHSGNPADREKRSAEQHRTRGKGAGLGLPFAVAMVEATRVPVGLVATAHGGTSMEQWNPAKKDEGGKSLYGSFLRQVKLAGGKVKGVLWYQGESDANPDAAKVYPKVFADFIAAVRKDLGQPELPFYYVQIGRFIRAGDPKPWNAVQDAQRTLVERVPHTAVVSVIDLELDDLIHVGTQGQKRAGQRLARVAQRELFGLAGGTTPTLDRVVKGANNTLVVKFKGVNVAHESPFGRGMSAGQPAMGGMPGGLGGTGGPPGRPSTVVGLTPPRHIAGFSIRKDDGSEIPLIYEAAVGPARDTVVLKLWGEIPPKAHLWYGYGYDPYCNLVDGLDMAVPVFGPIALDDVK